MTEQNVLTVSTDQQDTNEKNAFNHDKQEKMSPDTSSNLYDSNISRAISPLALHTNNQAEFKVNMTSNMERVSISDAPIMYHGKEHKETELTTKKSRRELPPQTVALLKGWMLSPEHIKHPYPTDADKQMLLEQTGLNMKQLTNWFTNARKRIWKPMMRQQQSKHLQRTMHQEHYTNEFVHAFPSHNLTLYEQDALEHHANQTYAQKRLQLSKRIYPPRNIRSMSESATTQSWIQPAYQQACMRKRSFVQTAEYGYNEIEKRHCHASGLPPHTVKALENWIQSKECTPNLSTLYPSKAEKRYLARELGISIAQIEQWFHLYWTSSQRYRNFGDKSSLPPTYASANTSSINQTNRRFFPTNTSRSSIPTNNNPLFPSQSCPPSLHSSIPTSNNPLFPSQTIDRSSLNTSIPSKDNSLFPNNTQVSKHDVNHVNIYDNRLKSANVHQSQVSSNFRLSTMFPTLTPSTLHQPESNAPTMGQPRDGRSHTLDMGLFSDARRRKMTFQDVLASSKKNNDLSHSNALCTRLKEKSLSTNVPLASKARPYMSHSFVSASESVKLEYHH